MGKVRLRRARSAILVLGGAVVGSSMHGCGAPDRPDLAPACTEEVCDPVPRFASGSIGEVPDDDGAGGTGGLIENAPPAGAPAEGLGVGGTLAGPVEIGIGGTIGVDGLPPAAPVTRPGGTPALPGPDDPLSPAPGAAVDPVTGLEPPREGALPGTGGTGQPAQAGVPQREPTEGSFTF